MSNVIHIPIRTPEDSRAVPLSTGLRLTPLQRAHAKMLMEVSRLVLEPGLDLPSFPTPDEIRSVNGLLLGLVNAVDPFIAEVGRELRRSVDGSVDLSLFVGQLLSALDGNAIGCIEMLADEGEEASQEMFGCR